MTKVKICGITNLDDARLSWELGADILGFNFYPGSGRYVAEGDARSILEHLEAPIMRAGVFVNQSIEDIVDVEGIAGLDVIQLHGDESPEFVAELRTVSNASIIKVFRVGPGFEPVMIDDYQVDGVLLDTYSQLNRGGTGQVFDWTVAGGLATDIDRLYLAGGLNPDNVAEAVRAVRPYAVDVASGVESEPGKKDPKKLEAFIRKAKAA